MLQWFAETTLVASGLAVLAALASRLRPISPTARHLLWLVVLLKMMTPPLLSWPWAMHWGDLEAALFPPTTAQARPALCDGDRPSHGLSVLVSAPHSEVMSDVDVDQATENDPSLAGIDPSSEAPQETRVVSGEVAPVEGELELKPTARSWVPSSLILGWLTATVLLAVAQASRIIRFRRRLRAAVPAPDHLVEETERIGRWLGVRTPEVLVLADLGTPLLWCLGRPKLLLPAHLVETLELERWQGILTHELAHLRRGDHWVSRIELAAGLIWWWNPIYWLTRSRLDAEAELACDAWVVWTLPKHRLAYAEALFDICSTLSLAKAPAPALGAAGSGRFFERRLTMILHDEVPCRLSPFALLVACLLAVFALPSWSAAKPVASPESDAALMTLVSTSEPAPAVSVSDDDDDDDDADDADDDDDDADDDDDDDSDKKAEADAKKAQADAKKAQADMKKAQAEIKKAQAEIKKAQADARKAGAGRKKAEDDVEIDLDLDFSKLGKEIEAKFGPDFQKKMEELGERIEKEIEGKFGPDFEKKMEALGEKIGKEMETKFGPGSEFEKKMKELGKELESKLGPGSEFEKKMRELGKEMETKFGPGSDFAKKVSEGAMRAEEKQLEKAKSTADSARGKKESSKAAAPKTRQRERRIALIEEQIRKLAEELKTLKADDDQD